VFGSGFRTFNRSCKPLLFFLGFVWFVFLTIEKRADRQDRAIHQEKAPKIIGGLPKGKIGRPGDENEQFGIHVMVIGCPSAILYPNVALKRPKD
jgi:hypothetical protein